MDRDENNRIDLNANPFVKKIREHVDETVSDLRRSFFRVHREMAPELNILDGFPLSVNKFLSSMVVILGSRGCGKTNTVSVIAEELLDLRIPISITDLEGEYWSLKGAYPWLKIVGNTRKTDLRIPDNEQSIKYFAEQLAQDAVYKQQAYILDLCQTDELPMAWFLADYFNSMYEKCEDLYYEQNQTVHVILMEEAQVLIPLKPIYGDNDWARAMRSLKQISKIIATQGRKRGLGAILATQRNQEIDRTITSQADIRLMHRVSEVNDMKLYADLFSEPFAWLKTRVPDMGPGDVLYRDKDIKDFFKVRMRSTFHPSRTPDYSDSVRWRKYLDAKNAGEPTLNEFEEGKQ